MEDAADGITSPMYVTRVPWESCPELSIDAMLVTERRRGKKPKKNFPRDECAHAVNVVDMAARTAYGRRGVSHICIPKDIQEWKVSQDHRSNANVAHHSGDWSFPSSAKPAHSLIQKAADVINAGSRVVIFAGRGALGCREELTRMALLSFAVWAHHMFATGMGHEIEVFFAAGSALTAVSTGIKILNWIATMWGGKMRFTAAMQFASAFLIEFTICGLSGVLFAVVPMDWQLTDT